jgi:hypothetical protein
MKRLNAQWNGWINSTCPKKCGPSAKIRTRPDARNATSVRTALNNYERATSHEFLLSNAKCHARVGRSSLAGVTRNVWCTASLVPPLDEQTFRFNYREENDAMRFLKAVGSAQLLDEDWVTGGRIMLACDHSTFDELGRGEKI